MLHRAKGEFIKVLERSSAQTGFPLRLLEKDYYITIILSQINEKLSPDLIFKGATCLNKIYHSYYRLSEDLDFSLKLPQNKTTRAMRRKLMGPIKESIKYFVENFDMNVESLEKAGHRESTQYIYYLAYRSAILNKKESIKFEIGLRFNPILPVERHGIVHKFLHPFTGESLFNAGSITCMALKELVAEKLRAAATRLTIAPRDFYDLGYMLNIGFDFRDEGFLDLLKRKLEEDGFASDLKEYELNLGRSQKEINDMKLRIDDELTPVLNIKGKELFNIDEILNALNRIFKKIK